VSVVVKDPMGLGAGLQGWSNSPAVQGAEFKSRECQEGREMEGRKGGQEGGREEGRKAPVGAIVIQDISTTTEP
jgi:hypothetical protein